MTRLKDESLPEILAGLQALATELRDDVHLSDDGIPVLTTAVAAPARAAPRMRTVGAPIPTLSTVVARPTKEPASDLRAASEAAGLTAHLRAAAVIRRLETLWRDGGNAPLDPAIMAALEHALIEALQTPD